MIGRQFCTSFHTNTVQHWTQHVSWSYAEIEGWLLPHRISAPAVLVQISPLEESVHYAQCVATAKLQQELSVIIYVSFAVYASTPFHAPASFLTCALKSPKWIVDSLVLIICCASVISSTNSGYSALDFGPYTWIKHMKLSNNFNLNMHVLFPSWIYSLTQLDSWGQRRRGLIDFSHFMVVAAQSIRLDRRVAPSTQQLLRCMCHGKAMLWTHWRIMGKMTYFTQPHWKHYSS